MDVDDDDAVVFVVVIFVVVAAVVLVIPLSISANTLQAVERKPHVFFECGSLLFWSTC